MRVRFDMPGAPHMRAAAVTGKTVADPANTPVLNINTNRPKPVWMILVPFSQH